MFDSVLHNPARTSPARFSASLLIVLFLHAAALLPTIYLRQKHAAEKKDPVVVFVPSTSAPPPPPPPPPKKTHRETHKVIPHRPDVIVQPTVVPTEKPPEVEPPPEAPDDEDDGVEGGVEGGVKGGVVGGVVGGVIGGTLGGKLGGTGPVAFNDKMTAPHKLSGPDPEYTPQAIDHEVQGLMMVKCIVTIEGKVHDCKIIKSLPFLDRVVLEALEQRRYSPALLDGKPVDCEYVFSIRMQLPE